ncbi:Gfo/Idh/MocA family protein [uncultured Sphingomonas sp.]|uniref:Gfo/Idh/MocA family protein n=1 Tax=uncultured Sphingomonas sp. TaxID=158754 RepID=UPI0035CA7154
MKPRIGFLGVGWIGRSRMEAMLGTGMVEAIAIADPLAEMVVEAVKLAPDAAIVDGLDAMLAMGLDGVVIATPSALHAEQSIRALEAGAAVFCQKPLGRDAAEARAVVDAARAADRLLAVDFSYRYTAGMAAIARLVRSGELGRVFAVDLTFHNAYGPDKPWFYDRARSGGGCVMDLGVHLVDLAMWCLDADGATDVHARLFAGGAVPSGETVEDYAVAQMTIGGAAVRLACSWRVNAGVDAEIGATFYGTEGGAGFRNVGGSFYDFEATRFRGTARESLAGPPDDWGGRAAADWARRLAAGARFDRSAEGIVEVARVLDQIYAG